MPRKPSANPVGRPRRSSPDEVETRDQVLDAAEKLLGEVGYAGMSMKDVAQMVGVTKGTLYHHFPEGKDALVLAMAHRMLGRVRAGMDEATRTTDGARDRLEAIAIWMFAESRRVGRVLRDASRFMSDEHSAEMYEGFMTHLYMPVEAVLRVGIERGEFRSQDTTFSTWAFLGLLSEFGEIQTYAPRPALAEQVVDFVVRGIGGDEA